MSAPKMNGLRFIPALQVWLGTTLVLGTLLAACAPTASPATPTVAWPTVAPVPDSTLVPLPALFPKIDRYPSAISYGRGQLMVLPTYKPYDTADYSRVDLRGWDISAQDLRTSLNDLMYADFDTLTTWPPADKLPAGFDAAQILELGKNPGLGVRNLHAKEITGRGVGIAIIDQPMLVDHQEYKGQLRLYEEINIAPRTESQMHGPAVASIAVGKTVGVAPEADLYYIAAEPGDWGTSGPGGFTYNFHYIAQGIRRILDLNEGLPAGRKIRVISISVGWSSDQKGYDEVTAAVKAAKAAGLLVVSSSLEQTFGFKFHTLGRTPVADPDQFSSYEPGLFWAKDFYAGHRSSDRLLVPMDSRTTASPNGANAYVFYREGGWSWSIPYIAATYALAAQVKPAITPDEFWRTALQTGCTIQLTHAGQTVAFGPILDPVALIAALQTGR